MIPTADTPPPGLGQNAQFTTTHWSVVLAAGGGDSPAARQALEYLCQTYWYPVYAYVRRRGNSPHDAEDLAQEFFAKLIKRNDFAKVSRERGPFRAFLKGALNHLLSDQRDYVRAAKRGGGKIILSLDAQTAEQRYQLEPADTTTPDKLYDRRWALSLLETARSRLAEEYAVAGKSDLYKWANPRHSCLHIAGASTGQDRSRRPAERCLFHRRSPLPSANAATTVCGGIPTGPA
jgi:RNA polymerase sigma-70 factor (ECF subfamily)